MHTYSERLIKQANIKYSGYNSERTLKCGIVV